MQIEFSRIVQEHTDDEGGEIEPHLMWKIFSSEYLESTEPRSLVDVSSESGSGKQDSVTATVIDSGAERKISGEGSGPVSAFVDAISELGYRVQVHDYAEHALSAGGDAQAAAYVECEVGEGEQSQVVWRVGVDANIVSASLKAVVSAVNRAKR